MIELKSLRTNRSTDKRNVQKSASKIFFVIILLDPSDDLRASDGLSLS